MVCGGKEQRITRTPCALASSATVSMLLSAIFGAKGLLKPITSFVPARITTAFGCKVNQSCRNRKSICEVVCSVMPRSMYGLPAKNDVVPQR
jgi:hypothetical protein